jgi:hypothetical protein
VQRSLAYTVNYPSGLSLGEARLISHKANDRWYFEMVLDGVPGFAVSDRFRSTAGLDSARWSSSAKPFTAREIPREDHFRLQEASPCAPPRGGKTEVKIGACAYDALALVYHVRRELGQARRRHRKHLFGGAIP